MSDSDEASRKRIRLACLNCRRKKVRCGGERPACHFCRRLAQTCVYTEDGRRNRASLRERVIELQNATFNERFDAFEGQLSKLGGQMERLERLLSAQHAQRTADVLPDASDPAEALGYYGPALAPPIPILLDAVDVFFRYSHNQPCSLFHEATLRRRLVTSALPVHQMWALMAVARQYTLLPDIPRLDPVQNSSLHYAKLAWDDLIKQFPWGEPSSTDEIVQIGQTVTMLVCVEHPAGHCSAAHVKLGLAVRLALYAQLQLEPSPALPAIVREERRRTFWSLYILDKLNSLARERFPALPDLQCRLRLPCAEAVFQEAEDDDEGGAAAPLLDVFTGNTIDAAAGLRCSPLALVVVLASTVSRVAEYVLQESHYERDGAPWLPTSRYTAVSATLLQLELHCGMGEPVADVLRARFGCDIVSPVSSTADQCLAGSFIYARGLFHLAQCLLHHPFFLQQRLAAIRQRAPARFLRTAWETCRRHAAQLVELRAVRRHQNRHVVILPSLYGYCIMVAGTIHVIAMHDEDDDVRRDGKAQYAAAVAILQELACYWRHAALMVERLDRFRRDWTQSWTTTRDPGPHNADALWRSVDYAVLSTPSRPASPSSCETLVGAALDHRGPATETLQDIFYATSRLFDFSDLGTLSEAATAGAYAPFTMLNAM